MSKFRYPLLCLILGILVGWTASILRYQLEFLPFKPPVGPGAPPPPLSEGPLKEAGVSDAQIEKIMGIQKSAKQAFESAIPKMEAARIEFENAVDSSQNIEELRKKYLAFSEAKNALDQLHFEIGMQIHKELTLEQSKKLREEGRKKGFPPPPPGRP